MKPTLNFTLSDESKETIKKYTGMSADDISKMDTEKVDRNIEEKIGKKLKLGEEIDSRLIGRGSVYIFLHRILGLDFVNNELAKI